jgi:hypothetical protein
LPLPDDATRIPPGQAKQHRHPDQQTGTQVNAVTSAEAMPFGTKRLKIISAAYSTESNPLINFFFISLCSF